jgi:threonyl-tRNA synthetase
MHRTKLKSDLLTCVREVESVDPAIACAEREVVDEIAQLYKLVRDV